MKSRGEFAKIERVVVKIGSRLLSDDVDGRIQMLASEAAALRARGIDLSIVTSGAIALGMKQLGLSERPHTIPGLQAAAAVGQGRLIHLYERALDAVGLRAGQILLTHDDVRNRRRYLNARHALSELLSLGAVPVINENDTVSVDEIKFGDNDQLAALCTSLTEADLLVILTDVDGLYDGSPATGKLIREVRDIDREAAPLAGGSGSALGTGGMASKVQAAKVAGHFGVVTVIAPGRHARPLGAIIDGEELGTVFWPSVSRLQSRKHWIAYALKPSGQLIVDAGAKGALTDGKKSLLPSGVHGVSGSFGAGDSVSIVDEAGAEFARGLCAYDAEEVRKIMGRRTIDLESLLGYKSVDEIIHRDDLVLL